MLTFMLQRNPFVLPPWKVALKDGNEKARTGWEQKNRP